MERADSQTLPCQRRAGKVRIVAENPAQRKGREGRLGESLSAAPRKDGALFYSADLAREQSELQFDPDDFRETKVVQHLVDFGLDPGSLSGVDRDGEVETKLKHSTGTQLGQEFVP